ncbi:transcriptional regulator [Shewanella hanedai]|uniref:Helix-turn-helix transcriptional regulator n=1 Tax=Shewanella hanedai TaxID=25 RepID=A0A553JMC9_SHEHA|nr:XRE family transcriptional regulator [Shewanella hanedai]TRY13571.1 helix-turn-helix transcriptional regulator [Shewanella hanedai]GGI82008.1 transcriptional regulator [Shewanella hanedai]
MNNGNSVSFSKERKETFSDRLEVVIGSTSVRNFANSINISEGALRKYLKGVSLPQIDKALLIAKQGNVSLGWLISGEGSMSPCENQVSPPEVTFDAGTFSEDFSIIPGYHISVSTGHGDLNQSEQVTRHLAFRTKWLRYRGFEASNLAVVFAHGDSMEPTIQNHNSLLVNIADTKLTDGSIFVLRFGEELYAKRLQKRFNGDIELISDNKEYKDQVVHIDEINKLHIIGKVVWIGRDTY